MIGDTMSSTSSRARPEPLKGLNKTLKLRPEILKYLFVRQDN